MIKASIGKEKYKTIVTAGKNSILVDEPEDKGGLDLGLHPQQLLAASLASCTAITLKMYTDRKEWDIGPIDVEVDIEQTEDKKETKFIRKISYQGNLDQKQKSRIESIANACPIHKILHAQIAIETVVI